MEDLKEIEELLKKLNEVGEENIQNNIKQIKNVKIFEEIFDKEGKINKEKYNQKDAYGLEYKELITRYLLLSSILDQGPDMEGVRMLLTSITNELYNKKVIFLHEPPLFFKNIDLIFKKVKETHQKVKEKRMHEWAKIQNTNPNRYNLFLDNCNQISSYIIGRWGPPLAIIQILKNERKSVLEFFKECKSSEKLSSFIKSDPKYGMGKAIGNKAAHLLVKWLIYTYNLIESDESNWDENSYELPFDSNAGRVLFMTGFFHHFLPSLNTERGCKDLFGNKDNDGKYFMYITQAFRNRPIEIEFEEKLEKDIKLFLKKSFGLMPRKIKVQQIINYLSEKNNVTSSSP